jgi:hypothetical protein
MSYEELLAEARACEGQTLQTATGRRFMVGISRNCPYFIPESTGIGRSDGRKAAEAFLERFKATRSLKVADYQDVTRNASYLLPLALRGLHNTGT